MKIIRTVTKTVKLVFLVMAVTAILSSCRNLQNAFGALGAGNNSSPASEQTAQGGAPQQQGTTGVCTERVPAPKYTVVPQYAGFPYSDIEVESGLDVDEVYGIILSPFDSLGRCGPAVMRAGPETLPKVGRESTGTAQPSGWNQNKYPGLINSEPPYLYNRAHLLMWALSGLTDNRQNLITGTRYLNVEGMLPTELEVVKYIEKTGNHVVYRVTPVFERNNLLASGVIMEAYGVEDKDFCIRRYAFNVQPGITLNYKTGENWVEAEQNTQDTMQTYILNKSTKKFHLPPCDAVKDILEKNRVNVEAYRSRLVEQGYKPCGNCDP